MAFVIADRVQETTTSTGTGTITLAGASTGFQSFSASGNGNNTYYTIAGRTTSEWEVGIGTYTASGTTLSRDTVLSSSTSGSLVNFSAGTKDVFVTPPASRSALVQSAGSGLFAGTTAFTANGALYASSTTVVTSGTLPVASGGTGQTTYTNGQLLIGNTTGNTLTKATLTGTANQVTVTNGTGSITLSGPQDLATTSSPTFANLYLGASGSSQLNLSGYNAYGGAGYHGFLGVTNTFGSATNPNKYFRLTSTGTIEIVNSAYTAVIFQFDNAGNFTATANVTAYSDERVKKNWRGLGNNFLEKLSGVKYGVFDRTDVELTQVGVSAQSLQEVMPEAVHTDEEDKLSVSYGNAALAACVELAKEVVALRARVAALEAKGN